MKIYIATSWKMKESAIIVAEKLREDGHEVDCFCDPSTGRYVFYPTESEDKNRDAIEFLQDERAQKAFKEDKGWIDWSDVVVMLFPCGHSAHLEAGYARGAGKKLYVIGEFPKGYWEVMYGFADAIFRCSELSKLRQWLIDSSKIENLRKIKF